MAGSALALLGLMQYTTGALAAPLAGAVGNGSAVSVGIVVSCFSLGGLAAALMTVDRERRDSPGEGAQPLVADVSRLRRTLRPRRRAAEQTD